MTINICGVHEVPTYSQASIHHIISMRDRNQPPPDMMAFKHDYTLHGFVFEDHDRRIDGNSPNEAIIYRLLNIYDHLDFDDDNVLFHCFAGQRRSTAAAYIYLVSKGVSYEDALKRTRTARHPNIRPNSLMVKIADKALGRDGKMIGYLAGAVVYPPHELECLKVD